MGTNQSKYGDPKAYFDDDDNYRSKRVTSHRDYNDRGRSYHKHYKERRHDIDKKPRIRRGEDGHPGYLPYRESLDDDIAPYDDSSYMRNRGRLHRESDRRYNRREYADSIDELSIDRYGEEEGMPRRSTHQVIPMERDIIAKATSYPNDVPVNNEVQYVTRQPAMTEVREIEVPVEEIIESPPMREQVVYVQSGRPAHTERIYERNEMPYATTQYISSDPAPLSSELVYSQAQPRTSYIRETVPARRFESEPMRTNTEIIRRSVPRSTNPKYDVQDERRIDRLTRTTSEALPQTIVYNVADGHYVESFDVIDSGNKKTFHKGYSGYLSENDYLGTRTDAGDVNTLFKSRRD